jgi:nicotinamide-nucleotide amidase
LYFCGYNVGIIAPTIAGSIHELLQQLLGQFMNCPSIGKNMKSISARLLMVGNELLSGKTIDTNAAMAARALTNIGVCVAAKETLPDEIDIIVSAIRRAKEEILIISGGLGPTSDDLTRNAIAKAFKVKLIKDEKQVKRLEEFFIKVNRPFAACNYVQAEVPECFTAIDNRFGTAPALFCAKPFVFALPGVPRELEGLLTEKVLPEIKKHFNVPPLYTEEIRTTGIGESILFEKIKYLIDKDGVTFGSLPDIQGVVLRFTGRDRIAVKKTATAVRKVCSEYAYGGMGDTLAGVLHQLFTKKKLTLSLAESCTGGLVASRIVSVPGSSAWFTGGVVAYNNTVKMNVLGVRKDTLKKFGAVSEQTALEMASGVRKKLSTDWSLSVSGIAGPNGGTKEKPVGTVTFAICAPKVKKSMTQHFFGPRDSVRERATAAAMFMLYREVKSPHAP